MPAKAAARLEKQNVQQRVSEDDEGPTQVGAAPNQRSDGILVVQHMGGLRGSPHVAAARAHLDPQRLT